MRRRSYPRCLEVEIHRPQFNEWMVKLQIRYNVNVMSQEQIVEMLNMAGRLYGVGTWRPGSPMAPGHFGMFHVKEATRLEQVPG